MIPLFVYSNQRVLVYCKSDKERQQVFQEVLDFLRKYRPNTAIARVDDMTLCADGGKIDIIFHEDLIVKTQDVEWDSILSGKQMEDQIQTWTKILKIVYQDAKEVKA